jgi:hypothetical protein
MSIFYKELIMPFYGKGFNDGDDPPRFIPVGKEPEDFIPVGKEDDYIRDSHGRLWKKSDWEKMRM